jgi:hypothetical protein
MPSHERDPRVRDALRRLICRPYDLLILRWNWKAAVLSSFVRASLFFAATLRAGLPAAAGAATAELVFRATTAGFYGAVTEAFVPVRPVWAGTLTAMIVLPFLSHSIELAVHFTRGTPDLARAIGVSVAFTVGSTAVNLHAMRHGALIVGSGSDSIFADLQRLPRLLCLVRDKSQDRPVPHDGALR